MSETEVVVITIAIGEEKATTGLRRLCAPNTRKGSFSQDSFRPFFTVFLSKQH